MAHAFRLAYLAAPLVGGLAVLVWRIQETRTPVSARKILIPPLGMSTGFFMFVAPAMRVPWTWALGAYLVGALVLSYPLARTSSLERSGDVILMRRSNGFLLILLGLLALRLALHDYIGAVMPAKQTAAVFFILAFGMISRWRAGMYLQYRALTAAPELEAGARSQEASA
jgi:membrane protein CcdC involved in cytochrome C biogenesis